jgi:hypothetical protein
MTRQGVSYRLKTADAAERARLISAPPKARWYPRKPVKRPEMCGTCERHVDCYRLGPESLVKEPTYCQWCSRPMTEAAKKAAPNFVSIVRVIDRAPAQIRKTVMSDIEE